MKIQRDYLGGTEVIDLATDDGWYEFWYMIVQDEGLAEELRARIESEGEVLVNDNEPEFIERYTRMEGP